MHRRIFAIGAAGLFAMGACTSAADTAANRPATEPSTRSASVFPPRQEIRVTRDADRGPQACGPQQVGETVTGFFGAINRGDADGAIDYLTPERGWYSVTEGNPTKGGRHFVARDSSKLSDYLQRRVKVNEQMFLLEIDVDYERARDLGHVAYSLLRTADDLAEYAAETGGKGAIDCDSGRIAVWSMAQGPKAFLVGGLCRGEADPPHVALACARR